MALYDSTWSNILKKMRIILILLLIASIVAIAGCTSQNNNFILQIQSQVLIINSNAQSNLNGSPLTTKNYEATGYCPYVS